MFPAASIMSVKDPLFQTQQTLTPLLGFIFTDLPFYSSALFTLRAGDIPPSTTYLKACFSPHGRGTSAAKLPSSSLWSGVASPDQLLKFPATQTYRFDMGLAVDGIEGTRFGMGLKKIIASVICAFCGKDVERFA
jgi:hypothetical protein